MRRGDTGKAVCGSCSRTLTQRRLLVIWNSQSRSVPFQTCVGDHLFNKDTYTTEVQSYLLHMNLGIIWLNSQTFMLLYNCSICPKWLCFRGGGGRTPLQLQRQYTGWNSKLSRWMECREPKYRFSLAKGSRVQFFNGRPDIQDYSSSSLSCFWCVFIISYPGKYYWHFLSLRVNQYATSYPKRQHMIHSLAPPHNSLPILATWN